MTATTEAPEHVRAQEKTIRRLAMGYPEAVEEFPWGHSAFKVRKKVFLFLGSSPDGVSLSVKLPHSAEGALLLPFAKPTGYGLGRSGWVSATFAVDKPVPLDLIGEWIDESYRAIAPKTLVKQL